MRTTRSPVPVTLAGIMAVFFVLSLLMIRQGHPVWWDEAVYYGMGKWIWSGGASGLWESSRPLVLPFLLGGLWSATGHLSLLVAKVLMASTAVVVILFTYLIARERFDTWTAILAALLLAFTATFMLSSTMLLTGMPSLLFFLLGIWLWLRGRPFLAGMAFSLCFLTRFFMLLPLALFGLAVLLRKGHDAEHGLAKRIPLMSAGFALLLLPFLVLNTVLYDNPLHPFVVQYFLSAESGLPYAEPWYFYPLQLIRENPLFLTILALPFLAGTRAKSEGLLLAAVVGLGLVFFHSLVPHKEMRLILAALPFLAMLAAHGMIRLWGKKDSTVMKSIILIVAAFWAGTTAQLLLSQATAVQALPESQLFFQERLEQTTGSIWISDPRHALYSDKRIEGLLYYPETPGAHPETVFIDWCDLEGNTRDYSAMLRPRLDKIQEQMEKKASFESEGCLLEIYRGSLTS